MQWEGIIILILDGIVARGHSLGGPLARPYPIDEFKLLIGQHNVTIIQIVCDCPPPVLILAFLDKLLDLVSLLTLLHLCQFIVVTEVRKLVVPLVWDATHSDFDLLVVSVVGSLR
jgi:hypothetical protein